MKKNHIIKLKGLSNPLKDLRTLDQYATRFILSFPASKNYKRKLRLVLLRAAEGGGHILSVKAKHHTY